MTGGGATNANVAAIEQANKERCNVIFVEMEGDFECPVLAAYCHSGCGPGRV